RIGRLAARAGMKLDKVGDAGNAKAGGAEREPRLAPHAARLAAFSTVGDLVQHAALGREPVLRPQPLQMDEGRLSQAIDGVLQGREGDRVGRFHDHLPTYSTSMISTPSGSPSRSIVMS